MSNKIPLVSWSGGVDSTANVINLFANNTPFETVYVKLPNNEEQQRRELKARKKILKKLTKIFGNYHFKDHIVTFVGMLPGNANGMLVQPYIWATSISYLIDMTNYSEIVFGYIRHDDFWHVRQDFETLLKASQRLLLKKGNVPELSYPLEWYTKELVISNFYRYNDKVAPILDMTSFCEGAGTKPCGICHKCKEMEDTVDSETQAAAKTTDDTTMEEPTKDTVGEK